MISRQSPVVKRQKAPVRLQLSRKHGFQLAAVSAKANGLACRRVDRATEWGNHHAITKEGPFSFAVDGAGDFATREAAQAHAVALHAADCERIAGRIRQHLAGVNLACWCEVGTPCHADTLLRIANEVPPC